MEIEKQRPSYVRFERRAVEDRSATMAEGHYVAKDVDFALITPIGSKDVIPRQVDEWIKQLHQQAKEDRIPIAWVPQYEAAYAAWKRGEDVPLNGTPIKGWQMASPAMQKNITSANVLTVEDLAVCNDEALHRIGMGAVDMKQKAVAWLKAAKDTGVVAQENAGLHAKLKALETQISQLTEQNKVLREENKQLTKGVAA